MTHRDPDLRPTITADLAAELYGEGCGRPGETAGPWTLVIDVEDAPHNRTSRWHERYWLVVRDAQGDTYGIEYGVGLTENQEDDLPWDHVSDDRELKLTRLFPHPVTTTVYRREPVPGGDA
jgi:hypothetical protein